MMEPYYEDDHVRLFHGDFLEVLHDISDQIAPVDLVVTDPPYFQPATHYVPARGTKEIRTLGDTSVLRHAYQAWSASLKRIMADNGTAYLFCDGQSYPITFEAFYGLGKVRPLVWDKVTSYNGYTWRHQHELIAWVERHNAERVPTGDGDIISCRAVPVGDRSHPAQKPVGLVQSLIRKHADARTVLDPFAGSGTTLLAAKSLGLKAIGIEIEEAYCEIAAERLGGPAQYEDDSLFGGVA